MIPNLPTRLLDTVVGSGMRYLVVYNHHQGWSVLCIGQKAPVYHDFITGHTEYVDLLVDGKVELPAIVL